MTTTPHPAAAADLPEALRLANELCEAVEGFPEPTTLEQAAAERLRKQHAALEEWAHKTAWVQKTVTPRELGMHYADILRARIEALAAALPEEVHPLAVERDGERCQACIDRHDGFYGSYAPPCTVHDDVGNLRARGAAPAANEYAPLPEPDGYKFDAPGISQIDVSPRGGNWKPLISFEKAKAFADATAALRARGAVPSEQDALRCAVGNCTFNGEVGRHAPTCTHAAAPMSAQPSVSQDKKKFLSWWEPYQLPDGWIARLELVAWHAWQAAIAQAGGQDAARYQWLIDTLGDQPHGKPTLEAAWDDDIGFWRAGSFFGLKDKASIDAEIDADMAAAKRQEGSGHG